MVKSIAPNVRRANPNIPTPIIDAEAQFREDFFVYAIEVADLDPAASTSTSIQIDATSHFKWIKTTCFGFGVGEDPQQTQATRIILPITMQITDGASGLQLFSAPLPLPLVCGEGDLPFIQPLPRIFAARSTINLTFANYGLEDFHFWVAFVGVKMFEQG